MTSKGRKTTTNASGVSAECGHTEERAESAILRGLTGPQREAVQHIDGPLLILAGPGSGKTRVVTHRIAHLIEHGIPSYHIVALTFTNKAAEEMRTRLEILVPGQRIWAGTFHAFCARLIRQYASLLGLQENYSIYDVDEAKRAMVQAITSADVSLYRHTPEQIASEISRAKNNLVEPTDYPGHGGDGLQFIVSQVYPAYQQVLLDSNAVDFDDLLMHAALLLKNNPQLRSMLDERFRYVLVDEYQDTNFAQYAIVHALSIDNPNLSVTGDPDQSIYGWRGASLDNILGFERDFPEAKVVRLEQNYRSTKRILRVADQLIANNVRRKRKSLFTENEDGKPIDLTAFARDEDEAEQIAESIAVALRNEEKQANDIAILYRTNAMSRLMETALRLRGIPYQIVKGTEFYQRREIKDVLAYLLLLNNPQHNVAFERIVNVPARKIGKVTLDRLRSYALQYRIPFLVAAREGQQIEGMQKRAVGSLRRFAEMIERLRERVTAPLPELIEAVLQETGYREHLMMEDSDEADDRLANVDELVNAAAEFSAHSPEEPTLEAFLEQIALVSDTDAWEGERQRVTLMTLHAAKGLEFRDVYIVGLEQGVLPHRRSLQDPDQMEEERRLLFVGITRAEKELHLSLSKYRMQAGRHWPTVPSNFLMELPRDEMEVIGLRTSDSPVEPSKWGDLSENNRDDSAVDFRTRRRGYSNDEPSWQIDDDDRELPSSQNQGHAIEDADEHSWTLARDDRVDGPIQVEPGDTIPSEVNQFPNAGARSTSKPKSPTEDPDLFEGQFESSSRRVPPEIFQEGMRVNHPQYGSGTITELSGSGSKRSAKVEFYSDGEKTFRLAFSMLSPADLDDAT